MREMKGFFFCSSLILTTHTNEPKIKSNKKHTQNFKEELPMMNYTKYRPYPTMDMPNRKWPNNTITKAPVWCSVDMRDGNQSLEIPMNLPGKTGNSSSFWWIQGLRKSKSASLAASDTEFEFARCLIDNNLIPDDVTVQDADTEQTPHHP